MEYKKTFLALTISRILANKNSRFYCDQHDEVKPEELPIMETLTTRQKNVIACNRSLGKANGFSLALCALSAAAKSVVNQIKTFNEYAEIVSPTIKNKVDKT